MPAKSAAQERLMEAAAHAKTPAGYGGVSRAGARKFLSDSAAERLDAALARLDERFGGEAVTPSRLDESLERLDAWFSNKDREAVKATLGNAAEKIAKKMNG